MRLTAQPGRGTGGGNWTAQSLPYRFGFAFLRRHTKHPFGRAERRNRQRESVLGHRRNIWEVAFIGLLLPAGVVQLNQFDPVRVLEVGYWRVVKRQMSILTDAKAAEVNRLRLQQLRVSLAFIERKKSIPVKVVEHAGSDSRFDSLAHVA